MSRAEGYYWVRATEKMADLGAPSSDEWVIEWWNGDEWDTFYADDDPGFAEIDERVIERKQ